MLTLTDTILICIDVQGNLAQLMYRKEDLFKNLQKLISGLQILDIPILWTEQNPQKLGPTLSEIANLISHLKPISKMSFSCCGNEEFLRVLKAHTRKHVLLAGIETHVCVYQTVVDLISLGYEVQVVADCVSSRTLENKTIGLEKIKTIGAALTTMDYGNGIV